MQQPVVAKGAYPVRLKLLLKCNFRLQSNGENIYLRNTTVLRVEVVKMTIQAVQTCTVFSDDESLGAFIPDKVDLPVMVRTCFLVESSTAGKCKQTVQSRRGSLMGFAA